MNSTEGIVKILYRRFFRKYINTNNLTDHKIKAIKNDKIIN